VNKFIAKFLLLTELLRHLYKMTKVKTRTSPIGRLLCNCKLTPFTTDISFLKRQFETQILNSSNMHVSLIVKVIKLKTCVSKPYLFLAQYELVAQVIECTHSVSKGL